MEWLFHSLTEVGCCAETDYEKDKVLVHLPLGSVLEIQVGNQMTPLFMCMIVGHHHFLTQKDPVPKIFARGYTIWQYEWTGAYGNLPKLVASLNDVEKGLLNEARRNTTLYMGVLHRKNAMGGPWRIVKDMVWLMGRIHYTLGLERAKSLL